MHYVSQFINVLQHCRRFWHASLRLRSTIRRHHPPQRAVLSQICCFGEHKVVLFQILLDMMWLRSAVCWRGD